MATKQQTITARVTAKRKREIESLAKAERRTTSNFVEFLLLLGLSKYYEKELDKTMREVDKP